MKSNITLTTLLLLASIANAQVSFYGDATGNIDLIHGNPMANVDLGVSIKGISLEINPTASLIENTHRVALTAGYWFGERNTADAATRVYVGAVYGNFWRMKSIGISHYTGVELFDDYRHKEIRATIGVKVQRGWGTFDCRITSNPYNPYITTFSLGAGFSIESLFNRTK